MKLVVMPTVFELFPNTTADLEPMVGRYGDVSLVEQAVDVPPHEDAIAR